MKKLDADFDEETKQQLQEKSNKMKSALESTDFIKRLTHYWLLPGH